jgi:hypothetical protein
MLFMEETHSHCEQPTPEEDPGVIYGRNSFGRCEQALCLRGNLSEIASLRSQ